MPDPSIPTPDITDDETITAELHDLAHAHLMLELDADAVDRACPATDADDSCRNS
jgi:hypothetical protein